MIWLGGNQWVMGGICALALAAPVLAQAQAKSEMAALDASPARIADLLAKMSVERKVAQLVEPDIAAIIRVAGSTMWRWALPPHSCRCVGKVQNG